MVNDMLKPSTSILAAAALLSILASGTARPAAADPLPPVKALGPDAFRPGEWTLRPLGARAGMKPRPICLISPERMARAGYFREQDCSYNVLADTREHATISYRCEGGWGRTEIRRDAADLYIVDAQGLLDNKPFARRAELKRTGDCKEAARR